MLSFSKYWQPYWQVVSIIWSVLCVIPIDIKPWLRTWSCLGKLRKLSMTKDRGVCWSWDLGHLAAARARQDQEADTSQDPGSGKTNTDRDGTWYNNPQAGHTGDLVQNIFYRVSCHSHHTHSPFWFSSHPCIIFDWLKDDARKGSGWILVNLSPVMKTVHVMRAWSARPRHVWLMRGRQVVTLEADGDEWWPGQCDVRHSEIAIQYPDESVCLFGSWLCLDNFNVSWISRPSVWWMVQDSVLLVVKRVWRKTFNWYTKI